jgi:hypothetical protein
MAANTKQSEAKRSKAKQSEAKRSKANSPTSSKRLESNIDKKTNELATLTRTRPVFFQNFY